MDRLEVVSDPAMDRVRARRMTLRSSMSALEGALAVPAGDSVDRWQAEVRRTTADLRDCLRQHVAETEGPGGFHAEVLAAAPRLSHAVSRSVAEHGDLTEQADTLAASVETVGSRDDVAAVRELGTTLISQVIRHRQRGADLIYEAYEYDIGGED